MTAALRRVFGVEAEMEQRVAVDGRDHGDVAAMAAIAAAGAAARYVFLAPERKTAVAAVACFDGDNYFIYEQSLTSTDDIRRQYCRVDTSNVVLMLTNLPIRPRSLNSPAGNFRKQRVVFAPANVFAGLERRAALAHNDGTARDQLAAEYLHAEPLRVGIAPVFGTA